MIITQTPYRISFFGGGSDYPAWFQDHGGAVLATTINRYCYITCRRLPPFFEHKSRVAWSRIETVRDHAEIEHPVIRTVLKHLSIDFGIEIHHDGDLPARSGLGSSSAFTVGMLHALHALEGRLRSKQQLADEAIFVEQKLLLESVGVQDQIETAFGGLNRITIRQDGSYDVQRLILPALRMEELRSHLMLFYTGVSRFGSSIAADVVASMPNKHQEVTLMRQMVEEAVDCLAGGGDLNGFGRMLHESWQLKRSLSGRIAPAFIDEIYQAARAAGAVGGKLLGAGGGGFMLFFVPPDAQPSVRSALGDLLTIPIEFERSGTKLIFHEPDTASSV
ncbi:D-glycero-alpha-D-manno-heptose-7-phosphate kinase [Skermanella aerolata]|uniref:GHMP family kinase ATP-binding protein n=1 Tax=Skermanella aerolata TaxID=393310 RepID=UPI003D1DC706